MEKWFDLPILKPHNDLMVVLEHIEEILSYKGSVRVLSLFTYRFLNADLKFKRLRFTQIKEATKINHATLHKTLRRLGKKGIIRKILLDVTKPRAEKNIVHYELTGKGKIIVSIVITRGIKSLYQNKYDVIKIKKLMI